MTKSYVPTADERVDVVWQRPTEGAGYPVVRAWTGIQFVDAVSGAGSTLWAGELCEWADDIVATLRESIRVAMEDAREGVEL